MEADLRGVVIELVDYDRLAVHNNVQKTVDLVLRGVPPKPEIRVRTGAGSVEVLQKEETREVEDPTFNKRFPALARNPDAEAQRPAAAAAIPGPTPSGDERVVRIFAYGIARTRLERAIKEKRALAIVVPELQQADAVMAIRSTYQNKPRKLRDIAGRSIPTVVVKSNTFTQIATALEDILRMSKGGPENDTVAMEEVMSAIDTVMQTNRPFELSPQPATIRKQQHQVTEARRIASESVGEEPNRRLRILPMRLG